MFCIESAKARNLIPHQSGIPYGSSDAEKLDIFGSDLPDYADICIYIHGGYWSSGSRDESSFLALALHPLGIKCIPVGYALCPQVTVRAITQQIYAAFQFAVDYAQKVKCRNIHLMGHSAGAHLIANLLCQLEPDNELIKNVVLISGVYDLRPLLDTYVNKDLQLDRHDADKLSPLVRLAAMGPQAICSRFPRMSLFVLIGGHDSPAFHDDARSFFAFFESLQAQGRANYLQVEGKDHFDIVHSMLQHKNDPIVQLFTGITDIS